MKASGGGPGPAGKDRDAAVKVKGLSKSFGPVQALSGIDFHVEEGEIFGLLGPNGAGKTTTIHLLTGLARPDGGTIRILGVDCSSDPKAAQHLMGVVPDESNLYPELTGFENLCFCGSLYGMRKAEREIRARELLEKVGLTVAAGRKFGGYSKGMKRRLTIAAGLMHSPPLLFLDEATSGIDVASARNIRRLLEEVNRGGTTIFLTTHYIEEAERLCRRVAFLVKGRIVKMDLVENLMRRVEGRFVVALTLDGPADGTEEDLARTFPDLVVEGISGNRVDVSSRETVRIGPLVRFFEERGLEVTEARKVRPSLEDVFVEITGIEAGEMEGGGKGEGGRK